MTMADWTEGYATSAGYTHGCFPDLNPLHARFSLLLEGLDGPPPGPCCELGFGQGLSLAMHAAGDPRRRWWGNDFMPEHAAQAQGLLHAAGVEATAVDQSFEDFFARSDLPQFAFIGLHGVWSWVSAANRERIVRFIDRHLLPGGVVLTSHNVLAGWSAAMPLRELMLLHFRRASPAARDARQRASEALAFVQRVLEARPALLAESPALAERVAGWAQDPPEYLLHELLNEDLHPMPFDAVARQLGRARLSFACTSDLGIRSTDLVLSPAHQALLADIEDGVLLETAAETLMARRFRRDYWVRGRRPLSRAVLAARLREQRVVLMLPRSQVPGVLVGAHGRLELPPAHLECLVGRLEQADGPLPVGTLLDAGAAASIPDEALLRTLLALAGARALLPAADDEQVAVARPATRRLNAHLLGPHPHRAAIQHLASPVLGTGVPVPASLQLLLAARAAAPRQPERWPALLWQAMQDEGQQLLKDGEPLRDQAAAEALLQPRVDAMVTATLPALRRLGVVE
jgi:SAM-dependent methyltransferase